MAEDKNLIGQFTGLGMYDKGGKFEPTEENINAVRAKALEEGKKYIGDATAFETFKDRLFDTPDATIALVSGTGETLSEFVLGLAKATLQGGQMATTTDPKRIEEIRKEPGFTSYFDQLNFPRTNIYDSKISGVNLTDAAEFTGEVLAPFPAGPLVAGAKIAATPVLKGIGQLSDDIIKSFTKGDSGFRASAGVKPTIINVQDKNVAKILEDFRTGNISRIEAGTKINDLIPKAGILKTDKSKAAGVQVDSTKFNSAFDEYLKSNKFEDIYSTNIYRSTGGKNKEFAIAPQRINAILKAKRIADEDVTDASYYVKFNNALEEFFPRAKTEQTYNSADNIFFTKASSTVLDEARSVFKYLNEDISKLTKPKSIKVSGLDSWNNLKVNSKEPIKGNAMRYLKSNIVFDESGKTFQNVKKDLLVNNKFVADNIKKTKDLFLDKSKAAVFGLDHIQPPRFGGTNLESNLRIIPQGEHLTLSKLPSSKTTATKSVKAKTGFEDDFFKEGVKIVDLIQKGNKASYDEAMKIANKLDVMVNDFKSVYKNTDFVVGEPHFAVKTGDKTASFVKYSDQLNLTGEQKKIINQIFNKTEYSHKPNAGKSIEKQSEDLLNTYEEIALLSGGKIEKEISKQIYRFNNGGLVGIATIDDITGPLGKFSSQI
jgi:hypothetical protein